MYQCVTCKDWFHQNCIYEHNPVADVDGIFKCNICSNNNNNENTIIPKPTICEKCKLDIIDINTSVRCSGIIPISPLKQIICNNFLHSSCANVIEFPNINYKMNLCTSCFNLIEYTTNHINKPVFVPPKINGMQDMEFREAVKVYLIIFIRNYI